MNTNSQRVADAQNRRYAHIARMENAHYRMTVAERNGDGPDPTDLAAFETARDAVQAVDVELRELTAQAREALGDGARLQLDVHAASGMHGVPEMAGAPAFGRAFAQPGRVDTVALYRALQASQDRTTGRVVCRTLLQGVAVGNMARTTQDGPLVAVGGYGAVPLVLAVQVIPCAAGVFAWNRVEPVTPPALGAKQAIEGAAKQNVELRSTPVLSTLETWAAYEKVSLQSLQDQAGLAGAVESLLTGAVLRAADAAAWTAFVAGSTAVVPDATDAVATIVRTAAKVAAAGGTGIRALLSPEDYADMMLAKASTSGSWLGLPPGIEMPAIVQSSGVPTGKLLVTASMDGAFVALRQSIETVIGLSDDDLIKNLRTVLVEGRLTPNVRNAQLSFAGDLIAP